MSVVGAERRRRWVLVAAGVALLVGLPPAAAAVRDAVTAPGPPPAPRELVRAALAADDVAYSGLASSRGGTSLPDLPRLTDVSALLGGTTRTRVWWAGPVRWRVDTVTVTGEQDVYAVGDRTVTWDYEANRLTTSLGTPRVRFPRADDLLPPQAAHRLLGGLGRTDRVTALPGSRRVGGRPAYGVRVVPGDPRSTVTSADVWTDVATGLPLAVTVRGPQGAVALDTAFDSVDVGAPDPRVLQPPQAPGADRDVETVGDLVTTIDRFARARLPGRLAGMPRTDPVVVGTGNRGTATYGEGLARFVVLPLRGRLGIQLLEAAAARGALALDVSNGTAFLLRSGVLTVVVALPDGDGRAYLLSGLVDDATLTRAVQDLVEPPR